MEQGQAPSVAPLAVTPAPAPVPVAPAEPAAPRTLKDFAKAFTDTLDSENAPPLDKDLAVPEPPPAPEGDTPPPPEDAPQLEVQETTPVEEEVAEVELEGKLYRVPVEIKDGYLRQADYTRKTQEVAEGRRQVESMIQAATNAVQAAQQFGDVYGQIKQADAAMEAFHRLDWNALRESDPVDYATKQADYTRWQMHRQNLTQTLDKSKEQVAYAEAMAIRAKVEQAVPVLKEKIPGWGEAKAKEIRSHAAHYGYSEAELDSLFDPRAVQVLHDAMEYRKLTAKRVETNKKLANLPPVAKPSARPAQSDERAVYQKSREKFRSSGGGDLEQLAGLLKHRLQGK